MNAKKIPQMGFNNQPGAIALLALAGFAVAAMAGYGWAGAVVCLAILAVSGIRRHTVCSQCRTQVDARAMVCRGCGGHFTP